MVALRAIDSDGEAKARNNLESSHTNFPALPNGTVKQFLLQRTTSE